MPKYILFNKPDGVLTTFTDDVGRPTLKSYLPVQGVYAAGRLDMDSEGLLFLTDDGGVIHRLSDPRYEQPKTYAVLVEGIVTEAALDKLRRGVVVHGVTTLPAEVEPLDDPGFPPKSRPVTPHGPTAWLRITLHEGKKHQIRHMTAAVGLPTLRLVRIEIGPLHLSGLPVGQWRYLTPEEVEQLRTGLGYTAQFLGRGEFRHSETRTK